MTDTQTQRMVGAYGLKAANTPNLDSLAAAGIRFDNTYTYAPYTPSHAGIFTGMNPNHQWGLVVY